MATSLILSREPCEGCGKLIPDDGGSLHCEACLEALPMPVLTQQQVAAAIRAQAQPDDGAYASSYGEEVRRLFPEDFS